jgi:hypothetical protein
VYVRENAHTPQFHLKSRNVLKVFLEKPVGPDDGLLFQIPEKMQGQMQVLSVHPLYFLPGQGRTDVIIMLLQAGGLSCGNG